MEKKEEEKKEKIEEKKEKPKKVEEKEGEIKKEEEKKEMKEEGGKDQEIKNEEEEEKEEKEEVRQISKFRGVCEGTHKKDHPKFVLKSFNEALRHVMTDVWGVKFIILLTKPVSSSSSSSSSSYKKGEEEDEDENEEDFTPKKGTLFLPLQKHVVHTCPPPVALLHDLTIGEGATLTVNQFWGYPDPTNSGSSASATQNQQYNTLQGRAVPKYPQKVSYSYGGMAVLFVTGTLTIEKGGKIDLTGCGYKGGGPVANSHNGTAYQGDSPQGAGVQQGGPNGGGGGAGHGSASYGSAGAGGGGYGSPGSASAPNLYSGANHPGGQGGGVYGDEEISVIHMGAGGGSGHPYLYTQGDVSDVGGDGGRGGGALLLIVNKLVVKEKGIIQCDGNSGEMGRQYGSGGGGGAGGSIKIIIVNSSVSTPAIVLGKGASITAIGGQAGMIDAQARGCNGINSTGGAGGEGRIALFFVRSAVQKRTQSKELVKAIRPKPFIDVIPNPKSFVEMLHSLLS